MKLKGVNPFEQHVEKIVLGLVMILFLAVLSLQFVGRPNDVDVGTRKVAPDQVFAVLKGQADQLQSQLTDLSPALPEINSVDLVARYNSAFEQSGGGGELTSALGTGVAIADVPGGDWDTAPVANKGPIQGLKVPATSKPIAASQWATLDPYAVLTVPEYERFVPATQPMDFASVSIEAVFNGKDLEAALLGNGDSSAAIPRLYWSVTGLAILGFDVEREELLADGSWGVGEPIETPPYTPNPVQAIGEEAGLLDLTDLVTKAAGVMDEIVRPMFPPTIAGELWTPPSERVETGDDSESTKITRLTRQLERSKGELDRLKNPQQQQNTRGPRNAPGRDPGRLPIQPPTVDRSKSKIDRLEKKIKDIEEQLKDLGVDVNENQRSSQVRTSRTDVGSVLEEEAVELWAHDLGVKPGATYRYRSRVVVNNPLFRKSSELDPDDEAQQALTLDPFARGSWSDWSEPVVVGASEYFFVTGAELEGGFGVSGSKATIELYKMFYGHYRRSTLSAMPGDGLATTVRMSGDLLMLDLSVIEAGDAAKAIEGLGGDEALDLPEGISELSNRMTIDLGVYVLDIYAGHESTHGQFGQSVQPMMIVLRDSDGSVILRSDLGDESSAAYALASGSASSASQTPLRAPGGVVIPPASELFPPAAP